MDIRNLPGPCAAGDSMRLINFLATAAFALAGATSALADVLSANFTVENSSTVASGGSIILSLDANGTVNATLADMSGSNIQGFGFDSIIENLPESNFSPTAPGNQGGWADIYGVQSSGFSCLSCGTNETWIIGNVGEFSSVTQLIDGESSSFAFYLFDSNGNSWGADATPFAVVPEPAAWGLLLVGFGLCGATMRRRARVTVAA
jgi:PEP-CTERM motif